MAGGGGGSGAGHGGGDGAITFPKVCGKGKPGCVGVSPDGGGSTACQILDIVPHSGPGVVCQPVMLKPGVPMHRCFFASVKKTAPGGRLGGYVGTIPDNGVQWCIDRAVARRDANGLPRNGGTGCIWVNNDLVYEPDGGQKIIGWDPNWSW